MTHDAQESSRADATPIRLFEFQTGVTTFFRFTDAVVPITHASNEYAPIPIDAGSVTASGSLDNTELRVTTPQDAGLAELYLVYPPEIPVGLTVWNRDAGDPDFSLAFTGVVLSCDRQGSEAVFACEPATAALRRVGLRRPWSLGCPYALYKGLCTASKAAGTTAHVVQSIDGTELTLLSGWNGAFVVEKYNTGLVEWTNANGGTESRTIIRTTATTIDLGGPARDLAALDTVDVILGCNRQMDDCETLHNVIRDFGGQPFIPVENPWVSQSYFR